jgi:hypothetical protein
VALSQVRQVVRSEVVLDVEVPHAGPLRMRQNRAEVVSAAILTKCNHPEIRGRVQFWPEGRRRACSQHLYDNLLEASLALPAEPARETLGTLA